MITVSIILVSESKEALDYMSKKFIEEYGDTHVETVLDRDSKHLVYVQISVQQLPPDNK